MAEENGNAENMDQSMAEEPDTITLAEILQHQKEIEEDAAAVLGGSDANFCTYNKGYIKRQALYACLTCVPEARTNEQKRAGVCLACTYKCHDGHELIELYTKRNFRCDCGTSKILSIRCKLDPMKMEDNDKNTYNQNFSGVYCTCRRPYPDPEDTVDDEMIQCILCEDWYHFRHLESKVPDVSSFEEMICSGCTKKNDFLQFYGKHSILPDSPNSDEADQSIVDVEGSHPENTESMKIDESNGDSAKGVPNDIEASKATEEILKVESSKVHDSPLEEKENKVPELDSEKKPVEGALVAQKDSVADSDNQKELIQPDTTAEPKAEEAVALKEGVELKVSESKDEVPLKTAPVVELKEAKSEVKSPLEAVPIVELNETEPQDKIPLKATPIVNEKVDSDVEPKPLAREEEILNAELNQCIREIIEINKSIATDDQEDEQPPAKKMKLNTSSAEASTSDVCTKPKQVTKLVGSSFWPSNWRKVLCKCSACLQIYKQSKVEFIVDLEDTVLCYQEKGMSKMEESNNDEEMRVLNRLNHVGRVEAVMGYNNLKEKLTEFLSSFVGSQRVVTTDDVNGFFEKIKESDQNKRKQ